MENGKSVSGGLRMKETAQSQTYFGVRVPPDMAAQVRSLAQRRLCSVSDVTRTAVAKELQREGLWPPRETRNGGASVVEASGAAVR